MKEVIRKEVVKMLEVEMIYPISYSKWVCPIQVVPKKGGMTVIQNDNNELILTRAITGWREFNLEIRDKSGKDNLVADYLSRLINEEFRKGEREIVEAVPDEKLFLLQERPWFADIVNYKASGIIPEHFKY
ncbi:PREDICTED: uncharacterized protein LOC109353700 [Lupinus angustifolius]|uniref:uncharacterized protein LOC109353700 n=1 Tax=Lupinus angustifolius TaxID=3871 RepID=UPI00092EDD46|nr:PREDICTED: uncharacterized protein LOC109353700 [Lupinus angustifolius]